MRRRKDVVLAGEALAFLLAARLALWLLPFSAARRLLLAGFRPGRAEAVPRLAWAMTAAARRLPSPFRACLPQALAAEALLRRHRAPAELIIGVRRHPTFHRPSFEAHAWVLSGERVVVGWLDDLRSYVRLAALPR